MEKKFSRNPDFGRQYGVFINEYRSLGHMTLLSRNGVSEGDRNYLPHHAVIKETSTTTKLRVVFHAARKTSNGKSLNDNLITGPTLQRDITAILLRWRKHKIVVVADVEKLYRQILVVPNDGNIQCILWRDTPAGVLSEYALNTVTYGTNCAPYLAIRTLQQVAYDGKADFPLGSEVILNDFYVDDLMTGADSADQMERVIGEVRCLLGDAGLQLRKWATNDQRVLNIIPLAVREAKTDFLAEPSTTMRALGIRWTVESFNETKCT